MIASLVARFAAWRGVLMPGARVRVACRVGVVCDLRESLAPVGVRFDVEPGRTGTRPRRWSWWGWAAMRDPQRLLAAGAAVADHGLPPMERVFAGRLDRLAEVRAFVAACVTAAGCPGLVDDAVLCADELFANAVRHSRSGRAGGEVAVRVEVRADGCVVCHVRDQGGPMVPAPRSPDHDRCGGRGLAIVAALAAAYGSSRDCQCGTALRGGRCVWFRLERGVAR